MSERGHFKEGETLCREVISLDCSDHDNLKDFYSVLTVSQPVSGPVMCVTESLKSGQSGLRTFTS